MTRRIDPGSPQSLGVTPDATGVNVAVYSAHADAIELCLFDGRGERELERIALPERTGDVFHAHVADIAVGTRYGLRAHGPYLPREGHRFNAAKLLIDPYAHRLDRPFVLRPEMLGFTGADPFSESSRDEIDSAPFIPKAIVGGLTPVEAERPRTAWSETIVYELHVRGFTKRHPAIPESTRGTFAGLAHPAALEYLTRLGITAVEIMPAAAWIDERHLPALGLANYWGYNPIPFFVPDPRLAPGGWEEIACAVAALHGAGIEVILDIVLNHSGESDELGPTVCYRGLDNAGYYRLLPDDPSRYVNDMGCGNCLALDRPPVVRMAMDALRAWVAQAGIDGLRFDLATALGRRDSGFDPAAPLLTAIGQDPLLRDVKLIAEPWDIGPGGYQIGRFPSDWRQWNDRYRDGIRRFWRGDAGQRGDLATRLAGSTDLMPAHAMLSSNVNFVAAHDGFSLADLVSYAAKHNEANGEHNRDGTNDNYSWNHGIEGPTTDDRVVAARRRDQIDLMATLLFSRGVPMLAMGSEAGHSQNGNNNAYAQDNETTWLDRTASDAQIRAATERLIALRKCHPALRHDRPLVGSPFDASGLPDVEWRGPAGPLRSSEDWGAGPDDTLVAVFAAPAPVAGTDRVAVIIHRGADPISIVLPEPRDGFEWSLDFAPDETSKPDTEDRIEVGPRSVTLLSEIPAPVSHRHPRQTDTMALDRLSRAAGITLEWWDEQGGRHSVPDATKRAILSAMGFAADSTGQATESLARLSDEFDRRPLPHSLVCRVGEPLTCVVRTDPASSDGPMAIRVEAENGATHMLSAEAIVGSPSWRECADGRTVLERIVRLPALGPGLHRLSLADRPEISASLAVVPPACHIPDALKGGARRFGISAQLYGLRRTGDQGIGDFSTLAELAERSAAVGAATVGINPFHALFPADRERASPYHPSDRRFLDPIYLDIAALDGLPGGMNVATDAAQIDVLAARDTVDYPRVWAVKHAALERYFGAFDSLAATEPNNPLISTFRIFVAKGGETLRHFAVHEALAESRGGEAWPQWPTEMSDPSSAAVADFAGRHSERVRFHMFLQFLSDRQFEAAAMRAKAAGLACGFYRDLAVGAAPDGAEVWSCRGDYAHGISIGAPPDRFSASGQVWNLPPPDPLAWRRSGYRAFRELILANMRHAGALRIDHVMALTRLFWIPDGAKSADGAYVSYPLDDLIGHLALASDRRSCMVVGEDLGTVPEGLREKLGAADILSYRVLWFERDGLAFKPPSTYPAKAVACATTHDLPTLAGWWSGADIAERHALGHFTDEVAARTHEERRAEKAILAQALREAGLLADIPDLEAPLRVGFAVAVIVWLAEGPSSLVLAQIDDLAGETVATNLPGTDRERPNWRRRIGVNLEALFSCELTRQVAGRLRALRGLP